MAGEGGAFATCSNGAACKLDMGLEEIERDDSLLVCGGIDVQKAASKPETDMNIAARKIKTGGVIG